MGRRHLLRSVVDARSGYSPGGARLLVAAASEKRTRSRSLPARLPGAKRPALLAAFALAMLSLPTIAGLPLAPLSGCGRWIALAAALELIALVGFVVVFKLVFCARQNWPRGLSAALRGLGASTALPAGGLIGPAIGAYSRCSAGASPARMARSAVAFVALTNAPSVAALGTLGLAMGAGLLSGPHEAALTLLPGGLAVAVLAVGSLVRVPAGSGTARASRSPRRLVRAVVVTLSSLRDGVSEARALVLGGDWKLVGALAYYAFDNAVLWAAFHAYGRTPAVGVLAMGYLVGSLGAALPIPAGIGAVEGGLIGALVLYGAPAAAATAAVLLYRGISLLIAVPLGTLAWVPQPLAKLHLFARRPWRLSWTRPRGGQSRGRPSTSS
jgi:uncharacterized membrane protein YbhN (UPF0104 family)